MIATDTRQILAQSLVTLDLPVAQPLVAVTPPATALEIRSACNAARAAQAKLNDSASFHGTRPTGFQRLGAKLAPWLGWGAALAGTGIMAATGGFDAAPLGAMLAGGAATGVNFFAPQVAEHLFASRTMSAKAVTSFQQGKTPFERALFASLAERALETLQERNVSSYESRMILRGVVEEAASIDPSIRASAERVAAFVTLLPAGSDQIKVSDDTALELGLAFDALSGEERVAVKALLREDLLAGKAPIALNRSGWTLLHDLVKPAPSLPMLPAPADDKTVETNALVPAQSRALVAAPAVATYRHAVAAMREGQYTARSITTLGNKKSDSFGEFAAVMSGFGGLIGASAAGIAADSFFFGATAAVFAIRASFGVYHALTDSELGAQLRGPDAGKFARAEKHLDAANPLERAIGAELATDLLSRLDKQDVRGIALREHLESIAAADVSPGDRASAKRLFAVIEADVAMRGYLMNDDTLPNLTKALTALTDSERRAVEPELFSVWVKPGKPKHIEKAAWQAFESALSGESK